MTDKNRERLKNALESASELIRGQVEGGIDPDDVNEVDGAGLEEYRKAAFRASKMILTLAAKYKKKSWQE